MIDADRLAELDTFRLDGDCPPDARIVLPARDVADLVQLISIVRAAIDFRDAVADAMVLRPSIVQAMRRFDGERAGVLGGDDE